MEPAEFQIVIIGGGGVGKSALTVQFIQGHFIDEYDPTIEDSYRKDVTLDGKPITLDVLDTAGQEEYSAMREQYVRSGQGFLLVYSVDSRDSFNEVEAFYQQILRAKDVESFPVVLVANKSDLKQQRAVPTSEGRSLANAWGCPFLETSAKERVNVNESFMALARAVVKYDTAQKQNRKNSTVSARPGAPTRNSTLLSQRGTATDTKEKDSGGCCCTIS